MPQMQQLWNEPLRCQFHQHFTYKFSAPKNYKAETFGFVILWRQNFLQKLELKMLMKLITGPNQKRARRYKNQVDIIDLNYLLVH
jgi:hypothetical protein